MRTLRLLFTFYSAFSFASILITLSCLSILYAWGAETFFLLFWFKIITLGLIFYFIHNYKKDTYYYFKNLGLSKKQLWVSTLAFDILFFLVLIVFTLLMR